MECRRGDIWMCDLGNEGMGSEQCGTRYCVIISNNIGNHYSSVVTIALITSKDKDKGKHKIQPTHVPIMLHRSSLIMTEQLRTISKDRLYNFYRKATKEEMTQIDKALKISLNI